MKRLILTLSFLAVIPLSQIAQAQETSSNQNEPLEITADGTLEWHRNDKQFIAKKNAKAEQGTVSVSAETLTADYRETKTSDFDIYQLIASENVIIHSNQSNAYGDDATYNLDEGMAVMTGKDLRLITPEQTITAEDRFEYWAEEGLLKAIGNAKVIRPTDELTADEIHATLKDSAEGRRELDTAEAIGHVVIKTATETLTGDYGIYRSATNKAEIKGHVVITRGPNVLEGDRAEVDLNTDTSRMFGDGSEGRVRGVFYPDSEKKPSDTGDKPSLAP